MAKSVELNPIDLTGFDLQRWVTDNLTDRGDLRLEISDIGLPTFLTIVHKDDSCLIW